MTTLTRYVYVGRHRRKNFVRRLFAPGEPLTLPQHFGFTLAVTAGLMIVTGILGGLM